MTIKILFCGATGYVGGSVLSVLLKQLQDRQEKPDADSVEVIALTRSPEKALKLGQLELVTPVVGDQTDLPLVERLSKDADVIFACVGFPVYCFPFLSVR